jgi:hypothetical protein
MWINSKQEKRPTSDDLKSNSTLSVNLAIFTNQVNPTQLGLIRIRFDPPDCHYYIINCLDQQMDLPWFVQIGRCVYPKLTQIIYKDWYKTAGAIIIYIYKKNWGVILIFSSKNKQTLVKISLRCLRYCTEIINIYNCRDKFEMSAILHWIVVFRSRCKWVCIIYMFRHLRLSWIWFQVNKATILPSCMKLET